MPASLQASRDWKNSVRWVNWGSESIPKKTKMTSMNGPIDPSSSESPCFPGILMEVGGRNGVVFATDRGILPWKCRALEHDVIRWTHLRRGDFASCRQL